tara:strand:- start:340 stop:570 length:231 start_codon:yes stop_codon:yes gene_type:complete
MNIERLSMYERLRDFKVPSAVLDNIYSNEEDLSVLENAYKALLADGFMEDEAADEISKMIFKELDIIPDQSDTDEK